MRSDKDIRLAIIGRFVWHMEREARIAGVDIEPEITKILEKLERANERTDKL